MFRPIFLLHLQGNEAEDYILEEMIEYEDITFDLLLYCADQMCEHKYFHVQNK